MAGLGLAVLAAIVGRHATLAPHHVQPVAHRVPGRAGLRKTQAGADERWSQTSVTVVVDPTLASATPTARDAIVGAFGAWLSTHASLPQVTVDSSSQPGVAAQDGVNRLLLGPITVAGYERALAITIAYADDDTGEILEADTIFNSAYPWAAIDASAGAGAADDDPQGCGQRYDLQNVATHEAGHFFGLGEDYEDTTTTMFVSSSPCQTSKRELTPPDVAAISGLYAGAPAGAAASASCGAHVARRGDTHGGALAASFVIGCVAARRRRRREPGRTR
jgi:hypothetical protein